MPLPVLLLVLFGAMLHASWNVLIKGGKDRYLDTVIVFFGAGLLTLLWLPFLPIPARASWPYLASSIVVHLFYFTLIALSYNRGDMSLVYPLTRGSAPMLTALGSVLFLAERPSVFGWFGVCLVSGGVLLIALDSKRNNNFQTSAILLSLLNAVTIVLYTLLDGKGARLSGHSFSYTSWGFLLDAILFTPVALLIRKGKSVSHLQQEWKRGLIGGGCSIAAYGLALWAMTQAPIASVAALRETSILFGMILAALTLKEKVSPLRIASVLLVVAGAALLKL